jgi:threonine/homoserine/homoserine lactone efflux protein
MTFSLVAAFAVFAFVTSVTPGPNNLMLLASGVNHGFGRTLPHMLGISIGFSLMLLIVELGAGQALLVYPALTSGIRYVGAAYMLWLAYGIARSGPVGEGKSAGAPLRFWQAALFQWVNPKAWVITMGAMAAYMPVDGPLWQLVLLASVFAIVNFPTIGLWAAFGTVMRQFLASVQMLRLFNWTMAALLVLSLMPMLLG